MHIANDLSTSLSNGLPGWKTIGSLQNRFYGPSGYRNCSVCLETIETVSSNRFLGWKVIIHSKIKIKLNSIKNKLNENETVMVSVAHENNYEPQMALSSFIIFPIDQVLPSPLSSVPLVPYLLTVWTSTSPWWCLVSCARARRPSWRPPRTAAGGWLQATPDVRVNTCQPPTLVVGSRNKPSVTTEIERWR